MKPTAAPAHELPSIDHSRLAAITGGCMCCDGAPQGDAGTQPAPQQGATGGNGMDKLGQIMNLATTFMGALKK